MPRPGTSSVSHDEDEETLEDSYDVQDPTEQRATAPEADDTNSGQGEGAGEDVGMPDELLSRAKDAGFTEQEARAFNPDRLDAIVTKMELAQAPSPDGGEPEKGNQPEASEAEGSEGGDEDEPFHEIGLDRDLYDPEIVDELESMRDDFQEEIERVKSQGNPGQVQGPTQGQPPAEDLDQVEQEILGTIEELPDAYAEKFGTEPSAELEDPEKIEARGELYAEMDQYAALYQQKGKPIPSRDKLVRKAANSAFPDIASEARAQEARQKASQRRQTARPAPSGEGQDNTDPTKEAEELVGQFLREHGYEPTEEDFNRGDFPEGDHTTRGNAPGQGSEGQGPRNLGF